MLKVQGDASMRRQLRTSGLAGVNCSWNRLEAALWQFAFGRYCSNIEDL